MVASYLFNQKVQRTYDECPCPLEGHEYEKVNHWRCYGCLHWYGNHIAHGCSRHEELDTNARQQLRPNLFLIEKRNDEIKRAWKKDQYAKVKGQFSM